MRKGVGRDLWIIGSMVLGMLGSSHAVALQFNMSPGVTPLSQQIYDIHMLILWICVVVAAIVYGFMFYSIYAHRKSKGAVAHEFHENTALEIAWTLIPLIVLVIMAVPATKTMINIYDTKNADMTVKVTGHQWKWEYEYLGEGVRFFSVLATPDDQINGGAKKGEHYLLEVDKPLVLPVGKKIRFVLGASDVLHSWWIPAFGWKQDGVPGFINENWAKISTPGIYRGQCAELCGLGHAFMPAVVDARSEKDYEIWLAAAKQQMIDDVVAARQTYTKDELMAKGEAVYKTACVLCHQATGQGIPGVFPAITGGPISTGPVAAHIDIVLRGKAESAMLPFAAQLDDFALAAVVTFERNALGNNMGDVIQPADVKAARASTEP